MALVVAMVIWSPLQRESVARKDGQVFISEVNYHDVSGLDSEDFIEIHNSGASDVGLNQWCISGVNFCFQDNTVLVAGATLVVSGSQFEGKLNNDGEALQLRDSVDNLVDEVEYSSMPQWAYWSAGRGHSLHRVKNPMATSGEWRWVTDVPSPGSIYSEAHRSSVRNSVSVVISEVNYHPENDNPQEEFVEIVNISDRSVDIQNWCLQELSVCFGANDALAPNEVRVVRQDAPSFPLSNGEGVFRLTDDAGNIQDLARYEDNGSWPAYADGHGMSLHRRDGLLWGTEPGNWEARPPTPGFADDIKMGGYLPIFSEVSVTRSPTSSQPIQINAHIRDGSQLMLHYRVNFGNEVTAPLQQNSSGGWAGSIPPQPDGSLVRYRLSANGQFSQGTWPRSGDGMVYHGTVVASSADTLLPRLQWFVEDEYYDQIYNDRDLYGDNGYPTVIAFDGEVFDGSLIRVRGNQSRLNQKRKWKIVLPPGYETTLGGRLATPVNEFALNSAVTDKSFIREILTSELQQMGGGIGQQVFPLRLERNNEFYGLYLYQEQPDGRWRQRWGFSEDAVAFKSDRQATLTASQLELPNSEMRQRYQRRTQRWLDHVDEIRELIRQVNNANQDELLAFVYRHLDIPQIVEALATMRVAQHLEWEHKNHVLVFDPADEKWRLIPIDFDLNFGRQYVSGCNSLCEEVSASGYMEYMEGNRLGRLFLKIPELREMLDRRTRTLADSFLAESFIEGRITEWEQLLRGDAARDRKIWFTYGEQQSMQRGQEILVTNYVIPKRELLTGSNSRRLPAAQNPEINYSISEQGEVTVTNNDSVAIDVSGMQLSRLKSQVPAGTVILPGQTAVFSLERKPVTALLAGQLHVSVMAP
jgi:spore coat protein CotH